MELTRDTVGTDTATASPLSSVAMSADGRYLALTTVRTKFVLPALQLLGEPRRARPARALCGRPAGGDDRAGHPHLRGGDITADVLNGPTLSADGARVAFASFASGLFYGDANATPTPSSPTGARAGSAAAGRGSRRRGPAGNRDRRPRAAIGVRVKGRRGGAVRLTVSVPAAGGVKAVGQGRRRPAAKAAHPRHRQGPRPGTGPQRGEAGPAAGRALPAGAARRRKIPVAPWSPTSPPAAVAAQRAARSSFDGLEPQTTPPGPEVKPRSPPGDDLVTASITRCERRVGVL